MNVTLALSDAELDGLAERVAELVLARMTTPTQYMTVLETAGYLRLSENSIRNLVASNQIPHKRIGRSVRFRASEIDAWLDARK